MPSNHYSVDEIDLIHAGLRQGIADNAAAIAANTNLIAGLRADFTDHRHIGEPDPPPPPPPVPVATGTLFVSAYNDRLNPVELEGKTLDYGLAYVFYEPDPEHDVAKVTFYLDGQDWHTENFVPYDFAGGNVTLANGWNTDAVPEGPHSIRAVATLVSGVTTEVTAHFATAVEVIVEPPPDPNPPPPDPDPDQWAPRTMPDGFVPVPTDATGAWFDTIEGTPVELDTGEIVMVRNFWFEGTYTRLHLDGGIKVREGDNYLGPGRTGPSDETWTLPDGTVLAAVEWKVGGAKLLGPQTDIHLKMTTGSPGAQLFYVRFGDRVANVTVRGVEVTGYPCWHGNYDTGQYLRVDSNGLGVSQLSPFGNQGGMDNWTIDQVWSHHNPYGNGVRGNRNCVISNSIFEYNGNMGGGFGSASGTLLIGNRWEHNTAHAMGGFESGALKVTGAVGGRGQYNVSRYNNGAGLWTDIGNYGWDWTHNVVIDNEARGIFHEISGYCEIAFNIAARNGKSGSTGWGYRHQIGISASLGTEADWIEIHDNEVVYAEVGDQHGIVTIQQARGSFYVDYIRVDGNKLIKLPSGNGSAIGNFDDTGGIFDNYVDPVANPDHPDAQDNRFGLWFPNGMTDFNRETADGKQRAVSGDGRTVGTMVVPPRFGHPNGPLPGDIFRETWDRDHLAAFYGVDGNQDTLAAFDATGGRLKMMWVETNNVRVG